MNWNQIFEEQLDFFKSKGLILNPDKWDKIASEVHARAFTVAHVANMDIIKDIREAMAESIARGETVSQFKKRLPGIMDRKGWTGKKNPYRLDNIYRTNLADSYNVGRYTQQTAVKSQRPFWRYMAVMDKQTRPAHRAMNGRIYRADSPVWAVWYPPNGFRCRCFVRSLSELQAKRLGIKIQDDLAFPIDSNGKLLKPDMGWRENTAALGLDAWMPDFTQYIAKEIELLKKALASKPVVKKEKPKSVEKTALTDEKALETAPERLVRRKGYKNYKEIEIDIDELDEMWRKDPQYIAAGKEDIAGRLEKNIEYFKTGKDINEPVIHITKLGKIVFEDGRHTAVVLRDVVKAKKIKVMIDTEGYKNFKKLKMK